MTKLSMFLYGQLHPKLHFWVNLSGFATAGAWLFYALVVKDFIGRFLAGNLQFLDILVGLPLVIALAPVLYALVYWSVKWLVILIAPHLIRLPEQHD